MTLDPSLWLVSGRMATQYVSCHRRLLTLDVGKQFDDRFDYFACAWSQESARVIVTPVVSGSRNGPFVSTQHEYDVVTPHVCFDFRERSLLWKIEEITSASLPQPASQSSSTQLEVPETSAGSAEVHVQEGCFGWSRHQSGTASDLSRTHALNKISSTACQGARPTHSGAQVRSELCVQKAVRTSGHCDITVQGGSLESSNPFNVVRGEGRSMFLKGWNNC